MTAQQLKNSILQMAVQGKLVQQDQNDEPASVLLERIRAEKQRLVKEGKIKKNKNDSVIYRVPCEGGETADNLPYAFHERMADGTVRDITEEIPFDVPENWEWVSLKDICKSLAAGGDKPTDFSKNKNDKTPVPVIANGETNCGVIGYTEQARVFEKSITVSGRGTIGYSCVRTEPYCPIVRLLVIIPIEGISFEYLQYCFESLFETGLGTSIPQLTVPMIAPKLIPLPPLAEQHRIVARIEELLPHIAAYDTAEQKLTSLNATFPNRLKKSILQAAVQGKLVKQDPADEPASVLLERIRAEKEALIKAGKIKKSKNESVIFRRNNSHYEKQGNFERCIDDEIPFYIPESWAWTRLGSIVYNHGQLFPQTNFCYIDIGSIDNKNQRLNENEAILSGENAPSRARKIVKLGDILYSTVRPYLHNMCVVDREFSFIPIASTGFAVMTCYKGMHNQYLFNFLLSPDFDRYANDIENAKGVAYPAINDTKLYNALVPLPPLAEQHRIVDKIDYLLSFYKRL